MDCTTVTAYGGKGAISLCHQGNTLPFTGFDLVFFVVIAAALILLGSFLWKSGE
jgi:hypothetical protein